MVDTGHARVSERSAHGSDVTLLSFRDLGERWRPIDPCSGLVTSLADLVESELLPRLMITFQSFRDGLPLDYVTEVDRERFLGLLLAGDQGQLGDFVTQLRSRQVPMQTIFSDLLAQTARTLGERWEQDRMDFTEVSIGVARLQQILRMHSVVGDVGFHRADGSAYRILLTTAPGEQHSFGLHMVAEAFRRDGWFVACETGAPVDDLRRILAGEYYDFIGLSASTDRAMERLVDNLDALRRASRNPDIQVMLGGGAFERREGVVEALGAAFCAKSATNAPLLCRNLLAQSMVGC